MPITSLNLSELILTFQYKEKTKLEELQSTLRNIVDRYDYRKNKIAWKKYLNGIRPCPQYKFMITFFFVNIVNYSSAIERSQVLDILKYIIFELPSDYYPPAKVNQICHEFPEFMCRFDEISKIYDNVLVSWNNFIGYFFLHFRFIYPFKCHNFYYLDYFIGKDLLYYTDPFGSYPALLFITVPLPAEPVRIEIIEDDIPFPDVDFFNDVDLALLEEEIITTTLEEELFSETSSDCIIEDQEMIDDFLELIIC